MTVYTSIWINDVYYWNIWDSQVYGINTIARLTSVVFDSSYLPFHLDIFHLFCILSLELGFSHPALDFRVYVTSTALFGSLPHIKFSSSLPSYFLFKESTPFLFEDMFFFVRIPILDVIVLNIVEFDVSAWLSWIGAYKRLFWYGWLIRFKRLSGFQISSYIV